MKQKTKNKKTKASVAVKTPKVDMTNSMSKLVKAQVAHINDVLAGSVRIRAERWHGATSVYDTHRVYNFLVNSIGSLSIDIGRFKTLSKEIPTFLKVIGPNLSRAISAAK